MPIPSFDVFEGPARYFVYGQPPGEPMHRTKGFNSLSEVEDFIWNDRKIHPGWAYTVWESKGWKEVKMK